MRRRGDAFFLFLVIGLLFSAPAFARPLLTEPVETLGFLTFEGGTGLVSRIDKFGPGTREYQSINFPVFAKFGISNKTDIGFELMHLDQKYNHGGVHLSGSATGDFSMSLKVSPWANLGFQGIWRLSQSENNEEQMSLAHGNDAELNALVRIPMPLVKTQFNVGYVWSGAYNSQFGVRSGPVSKVKPGNIFQAKLAAEIPIRWGLNGLLETAYYKFDSQKVNQTTTPDSAGEAMDLLLGLTWEHGGWSLGAGGAFGLLDEQHTSFHILRGAGDASLHLNVAYKLKPHKPADVR